MNPGTATVRARTRLPNPGSLAILELTRRQYGVVARRQLLTMGFTRSAIERRIHSLRLLPVYPGVYGVGSDVLCERGRWFAAVLAGGGRAVLSHRSAAALWGLLEDGPRVEVTRGFNLRREPGLAPGCVYPGLWLRRTRWLENEHTTERYGIPVMTVERTLLSLAATVSGRELEAALVAADRGGLMHKRELALILERGHGWRGIGTLKRLVGQMAPVHKSTRSNLEDRFIGHCHENRLPPPRVNTKVEGLEVDFFWPEARLVVETDGYESHRDRFAFERDRRRDATLVCAGYRVVRFTHRAVTDDLPRCLAAVQGLLEPTT